MAVRLTKGGLQSYDQLATLKKKMGVPQPSTSQAPKQDTPDKAGGQAYIKEREKRGAVLVSQGYSQAGALRKASEEISAGQEGAFQEQLTEQSLAGLEGQQVSELQKIDRLKSLQSQADTYTRLARAGYTSLGTAAKLVSGGLIGFNPEGINAAVENPLTKAIGAGVGSVASFEIAGFSLSALWSPASRNIKNLQGDVSSLVSESNSILSNALTRSPNRPSSHLGQAIESSKIIEEAIRIRYADATQSLKESPQDIAAGMDLYDAMSRDLRIVTENRQMLERYRITGDPSEIINVLGTIPTA